MKYSYPVDIWSIGLVIYELATGIFPFPYPEEIIAHQQFMEKKIEDTTLPNEEHISQEFKDFIALCLKKDPQQRARINDLLVLIIN